MRPVWPGLAGLAAGILVSVGSGMPAQAQGCAAARFAQPTSAYRHCVLGDCIEYRALEVVDAAGDPVATATLSEGRVFEDLAPRCADLDGDGRAEIVVVETDPARGAQLAIYRLERGALRKLAATPPIGRAFRWLAPAGFADFDGDGRTDIAYVETPHLGRVLRLVTLRDGRLVELAAASGVTNHQIGSAVIEGGVRLCAGAPQVVLASADWSRALAVSYRDGRLEAEDLGALAAPGDLSGYLRCPQG